MNMKQVLFSALLLCGVVQLIHGQGLYYNQQPRFLKANSVWCFGDSVGLNFNGGGPFPFKTNAGTNHYASYTPTSSLADPVTGQLLFYTDGKFFFKGSGQLMTHGSAFPADTSFGTCIVPVINQPGRYYVFSLNTPDSINMRTNMMSWPTAVFYSIVDMSMDNGRGDVDPAYQNILLDNDRPSRIVSVLGDGCNDIWVLIYYTSNIIKAYHITAQGIDPNPVVSNLSLVKMSISPMAVSPDRKKIAFITSSSVQNFYLNRLYIGDFNATSGQVTNVLPIGIDSTGIYRSGLSVCFSPDNSKLYAQIATNSKGAVYQFDVSVHDSAQIASSIKYIAEGSLVNSYLKLYNDTIYVAGGTPLFGSAYFLSRINRPNLSGAACQYDNRAIALTAGSGSSWQPFHNEVILPIAKDTSFFNHDTTICSNGNGFILNLQARQTSIDTKYLWSAGETTASIQATNRGIYKVTYSSRICHSNTEATEIKGSDVSTIITVNGFELGTTGGPFNAYQWLYNGSIIQGATQSTYTVTKNGAYQVIVANADGCTDTSTVYKVTNVSVENINYLSNLITIYPNPANDIVYVNAPVKVNVTVLSIDGKMVTQQENAQPLYIGKFPEGIYLLRITDERGTLLKIEKIILSK